MPTRRRRPPRRKKQARRASPTTRARGSTKARPDGPFQLTLGDGSALPLARSKDLQSLAMRWAYKLRHRQRWAGDPGAVADLRAEATRSLLSLGLDGAALERIARVGTAEVCVPFAEEESGWELRILPWEFLLAAATKAHRGQNRLMVTRHLGCAEEAGVVEKPSQGLVVVSAPGKIGEHYGFDTERELVRRSLGLEALEERKDPTLTQLRKTAERLKPGVVHLTGVDAHEGAELLALGDEPQRRDGLYLVGEDGQPDVADAEELAAAVTAGGSPGLVAYNCYYSAPRLASLAVAEGARAAIGFQDVIDNTAAERFYATFYQAWRLSGFDTLEAFQVALQDAFEHSASLLGSGLVLWSREPLLAAARPARARRRDAAPAASEQLEKARAAVVEVTSTGTGSLSDLLRVEVRPLAALNYALLHNDRDLFEHLKLFNLGAGTLRGVQVEVELAVGEHTFPYRTTLDLRGPVVDLAPRIRVPLAWDLLRTLRESTRTTIYVRVGQGGALAYADTFPVWMLPAEEWRDTLRDGMWLPSFVLPRDPAVHDVVNRAQGHLRTLRDSHGAGFDGYQSLDPRLDDPSEGLDLQVRALWSTLAFDVEPRYLEPPPTYTESSQRLRCPSEVVEGRQGTCIDLALALASCLEWIGVFPVVFLLRGHALTGYWRSPEAHHRFVLGMEGEADEAIGGRQRFAWMIESQAFDEVQAALLSEDLVPLEATLLTRRGGYYEAIEEGIERLRSESHFEALVDVTLARRGGVTPLPFHAGGA